MTWKNYSNVPLSFPYSLFFKRLLIEQFTFHISRIVWRSANEFQITSRCGGVERSIRSRWIYIWHLWWLTDKNLPHSRYKLSMSMCLTGDWRCWHGSMELFDYLQKKLNLTRTLLISRLFQVENIFFFVFILSTWAYTHFSSSCAKYKISENFFLLCYSLLNGKFFPDIKLLSSIDFLRQNNH